MIKILVSSCLLGNNCKWNGRNNLKEEILALKDKYELIPICGEVSGGMPTPRIPSEIVEDKVLNQVYLDVTKNYEKGAKVVLETAINNGCKYAILKDHSPSCGVKQVYDGTFTRKLISGKGITTRLLTKNGIKCFADNEVKQLVEEIEKDNYNF